MSIEQTEPTAPAGETSAEPASAHATERHELVEPVETPGRAPLEEGWADDYDELPPRPRRRLLGSGANPIALALLGVLLIACGFIGGVLVEKGQTSTPSTGGAASALASRFAALRGAGSSGASSTGASGTGASTSGASGAASTGSGGLGRFFGAAGGATVGEVTYAKGGTLYVTDSEGNTVKVTTSSASQVTKTVKADVQGIHPGETVVVRGSKGANGQISAESISVGGVGGGVGGGLGALFGGGGGASGAGGGGAGGAAGSGGGAGGGEPGGGGKGGGVSLFGN
ncbi:MAG TPA: hypothetical protein VMU32_02585 [Solirubrobacteraceae bacterium]|nr:hypothetical protein [Solirubrobacteraceae bacterium]